MYGTSICVCTVIIRMMWCYLDRFIQPCLSKASLFSPREYPVGTVSLCAWRLSNETFTSMSSTKAMLVYLSKAIRELNSLWCCCEAAVDEPVPLGLISMRPSTCFCWRADTRKASALRFVSPCHGLYSLAYSSSVFALQSASPSHM